MNKVTWTIFAVITAGILAWLVILSGSSRLDVSDIDTNAVQAASEQNGNIADHTFGKMGSKVTLIEYGDFQCPGCGGAHPRIKAITEEYKDQLQFVFRNFPLTSIHPNAKAAAGVAEAAGLQGKYWEMHNKIFETQDTWGNLTGNERLDAFTNYATELGLDLEKFKTDLAGEAINKKIAFDQALAKKINVQSTPTFYLNGTELSQDIWSDDTKLKEAINAELKKAGVELPKSTE